MVDPFNNQFADVPVVILAGGRGARFDHESQAKPKPMIEVCGRPMLRHIIDNFVNQGFRKFIIAAGYLGEQIDEYFSLAGKGPFANSIDPSLPWQKYGLEYHDCGVSITVANTGLETHTGERLLRCAPLIGSQRFVLTYGDGLSDVPMAEVMKKHLKDSWDTKIWWGEERPDEAIPALITVTSVKPAARFGAIEFADYDWWGVNTVRSFQEKPRDAWINGGFMIVEPQFVEQYLWGPDPIPQLESEAMAKVAEHGMMRAYKHTGYWRCMDTRRDLEQIEADVKDAGGLLPWNRDK